MFTQQYRLSSSSLRNSVQRQLTSFLGPNLVLNTLFLAFPIHKKLINVTGEHNICLVQELHVSALQTSHNNVVQNVKGVLHI